MGKVLFCLGIALLVSRPAAADKCRCAAGWDAGVSRPFPIDWGSIESYDPTTPFQQPMPVGQQFDKCKQSCLTKASTDPRFSDPAFWCANLGRVFNGPINAYARVDTGSFPWTVVKSLTVKCCSVAPPPGCPSGWQTNPSGGDPTRCVKPVCTVSAPPFPPDMPIGQWGFIWHNAIYQWGPPAAAPGQAQIKPCP